MNTAERNTTLRAARDRLGLSRETVARRLEPPVTARTIERWESGLNQPKRYRVNQLAKIYGVPADELGERPPVVVWETAHEPYVAYQIEGRHFHLATPDGGLDAVLPSTEACFTLAAAIRESPYDDTDWPEVDWVDAT